MKKKLLYLISVLLVIFIFGAIRCISEEKEKKPKRRGEMKMKEVIILPKPAYKSTTSVEEALLNRRSRRKYAKAKLTIKEVGQLLWAASGITAKWGGRTAPSAGATYPLHTYVLIGEVEGLPAGLYQYIPEKHGIKLIKEGDLREQLYRAALSQEWVLEAPINIIIAAEYARTTARYGERGYRYVYMEVGHVGQNIHLQCETLNLGTVVIGAFYDEQVKKILNIPYDPLYIMPVGRRIEEK